MSGTDVGIVQLGAPTAKRARLTGVSRRAWTLATSLEQTRFLSMTPAKADDQGMGKPGRRPAGTQGRCLGCGRIVALSAGTLVRHVVRKTGQQCEWSGTSPKPAEIVPPTPPKQPQVDPQRPSARSARRKAASIPQTEPSSSHEVDERGTNAAAATDPKAPRKGKARADKERMLELEKRASERGEPGGLIARRILGTGVPWTVAVDQFEQLTGVRVTHQELAVISSIRQRRPPVQAPPPAPSPAAPTFRGGPRPERGSTSIRTVSGGLPGQGGRR